MIWTVVRSDHAIAQLTNLWLDAMDRKAITAISRKFDVLLREGAFEVGEEREPPERVLIEKPLALLYEVHEEDFLVYVIAVWRW